MTHRRRWVAVGGSPGTRYPDELVALRGRAVSGVYAIRDRDSHEVLYVGESHSDRLYATITRHFQRWTRSSSKRRGMTGANDPGVVYDRDGVQVTWRIVPSSAALRWEARWIAALRPRDNAAIPTTTTTPARSSFFDDTPLPF